MGQTRGRRPASTGSSAQAPRQRGHGLGGAKWSRAAGLAILDMKSVLNRSRRGGGRPGLGSPCPDCSASAEGPRPPSAPAARADPPAPARPFNREAPRGQNCPVPGGQAPSLTFSFAPCRSEPHVPAPGPVRGARVLNFCAAARSAPARAPRTTGRSAGPGQRLEPGRWRRQARLASNRPQPGCSEAGAPHRKEPEPWLPTAGFHSVTDAAWGPELSSLPWDTWPLRSCSAAPAWDPATPQTEPRLRISGG